MPTAKRSDADIEREIATIGAALGLIAPPTAETLMKQEDGVYQASNDVPAREAPRGV
jgi:hypothetical protein